MGIYSVIIKRNWNKLKLVEIPLYRVLKAICWLYYHDIIFDFKSDIENSFDLMSIQYPHNTLGLRESKLAHSWKPRYTQIIMSFVPHFLEIIIIWPYMLFYFLSIDIVWATITFHIGYWILFLEFVISKTVQLCLLNWPRLNWNLEIIISVCAANGLSWTSAFRHRQVNSGYDF